MIYGNKSGFLLLPNVAVKTSTATLTATLKIVKIIDFIKMLPMLP